jgi:hypothetical protein
VIRFQSCIHSAGQGAPRQAAGYHLALYNPPLDGSTLVVLEGALPEQHVTHVHLCVTLSKSVSPTTFAKMSGVVHLFRALRQCLSVQHVSLKLHSDDEFSALSGKTPAQLGYAGKFMMKVRIAILQAVV